MSEDYRMSLLAERHDAELEEDDLLDEEEEDEEDDNDYSDFYAWLSRQPWAPERYRN